ncbi:MAG: hypothetical protein DSZ32_00125 [Gammaproteobacteria bacterium]|nr:MAG: hypothetical protein DSZ32_00125 [Gammaproteobacteria bacterium]
MQKQFSVRPSMGILAAGVLPLAIYRPSMGILAAGVLPLAIYSMGIKKPRQSRGFYTTSGSEIRT